MENVATPQNKIAQAHEQIQQIKQGMIENIEKVIDRGENIALLETKTLEMSDRAQKYRYRARGLRKIEQAKYGKYVLIGLILFLVLLILMLIIIKNLD